MPPGLGGGAADTSSSGSWGVDEPEAPSLATVIEGAVVAAATFLSTVLGISAASVLGLLAVMASLARTWELQVECAKGWRHCGSDSRLCCRKLGNSRRKRCSQILGTCGHALFVSFVAELKFVGYLLLIAALPFLLLLVAAFPIILLALFCKHGRKTRWWLKERSFLLHARCWECSCLLDEDSLGGVVWAKYFWSWLRCLVPLCILRKCCHEALPCPQRKAAVELTGVPHPELNDIYKLQLKPPVSPPVDDDDLHERHVYVGQYANLVYEHRVGRGTGRWVLRAYCIENTASDTLDRSAAVVYRKPYTTNYMPAVPTLDSDSFDYPAGDMLWRCTTLATDQKLRRRFCVRLLVEHPTADDADAPLGPGDIELCPTPAPTAPLRDYAHCGRGFEAATGFQAETEALSAAGAAAEWTDDDASSDFETPPPSPR
eukprot:COSAG05_NODE_1008_length_6213_cov_13.207720_7_plen_431_part_00